MGGANQKLLAFASYVRTIHATPMYTWMCWNRFYSSSFAVRKNVSKIKLQVPNTTYVAISVVKRVQQGKSVGEESFAVTRNDNNNGSWIQTAFWVFIYNRNSIVFCATYVRKYINYGETDQPSFGDNKSFGLSAWGRLFLNAKLYKTQRTRIAMELDVVVYYFNFLILHSLDYSCCFFFNVHSISLNKILWTLIIILIITITTERLCKKYRNKRIQIAQITLPTNLHKPFLNICMFRRLKYKRFVRFVNCWSCRVHAIVWIFNYFLKYKTIFQIFFVIFFVLLLLHIIK